MSSCKFSISSQFVNLRKLVTKIIHLFTIKSPKTWTIILQSPSDVVTIKSIITQYISMYSSWDWDSPHSPSEKWPKSQQTWNEISIKLKFRINYLYPECDLLAFPHTKYVTGKAINKDWTDIAHNDL